jgi:hypothetical protein
MWRCSRARFSYTVFFFVTGSQNPHSISPNKQEFFMIEIHFVVRSAHDDVGATLLLTTITGYKYSYLSTHPLPFLELIVFNL